MLTLCGGLTVLLMAGASQENHSSIFLDTNSFPDFVPESSQKVGFYYIAHVKFMICVQKIENLVFHFSQKPKMDEGNVTNDLLVEMWDAAEVVRCRTRGEFDVVYEGGGESGTCLTREELREWRWVTEISGGSSVPRRHRTCGECGRSVLTRYRGYRVRCGRCRARGN